MRFDLEQRAFVGPDGVLPVLEDDEISKKLGMLIEGECQGLGPARAAAKYGFTRQRYHQLRKSFLQSGAIALASRKRGPKGPSRQTDELICQAIRQRFLDPDASSEVIAQKLRQTGFTVSKRTVDRIFAHYGLQKKTSTSSARTGSTSPS